MYLLIRYTVFNYPVSMAKFTFHNVSINSGKGKKMTVEEKDLHSIMYLLILIFLQ